MKSLRKGAEPRELLKWKQDNRQTPENLEYGKASFPMEAVRCALLQQQHYLCAYTLIRLKKPQECGENNTVESCHIEHILPQTRGHLVEKKRKGELVNGKEPKAVINFTPGEDIDFQNMIACYPPGVYQTHCDFGAQYKDHYDPYDHPLFLSPLTPVVESHFTFSADGRIKGVTERGEETITALRLDHHELCYRRKTVITGALYPKGAQRDPISAAEARRLAADVLLPAPDGRLREFCVAIYQAALLHADKLERRARRMAGQR